MTRRIAIAALLMLSASAALAQIQLPGGKWWRRAEIIQELNLSEEQQDRIETVFRGAANDLIDMRADVEKQQIALRGALDQPQLDRNEIRQISQRLNDARGRLFQRELMMLVDMRAVLNDAQWNRMRAHLDRMGDQRRQPQQQKPPMRPRPRMND
jgi:Heavy-metal resistance